MVSQPHVLLWKKFVEIKSSHLVVPQIFPPHRKKVETLIYMISEFRRRKQGKPFRKLFRNCLRLCLEDRVCEKELQTCLMVPLMGWTSLLNSGEQHLWDPLCVTNFCHLHLLSLHGSACPELERRNVHYFGPLRITIAFRHYKKL